MRQVVIYPGEDGYWLTECPSLLGCVSQGKTREEATEDIKEAIRGYVAALEEDGLPMPEERTALWSSLALREPPRRGGWEVFVAQGSLFNPTVLQAEKPQR